MRQRRGRGARSHLLHGTAAPLAALDRVQDRGLRPACRIVELHVLLCQQSVMAVVLCPEGGLCRCSSPGCQGAA